ncbi:MAG TPA: hypothetical protein VIR27_19780 [Mycobacteriales bacterium]
MNGIAMFNSSCSARMMSQHLAGNPHEHIGMNPATAGTTRCSLRISSENSRSRSTGTFNARHGDLSGSSDNARNAAPGDLRGRDGLHSFTTHLQRNPTQHDRASVRESRTVPG